MHSPSLSLVTNIKPTLAGKPWWSTKPHSFDLHLDCQLPGWYALSIGLSIVPHAYKSGMVRCHHHSCNYWKKTTTSSEVIHWHLDVKSEGKSEYEACFPQMSFSSSSYREEEFLEGGEGVSLCMRQGGLVCGAWWMAIHVSWVRGLWWMVRKCSG